MFLSGILHQLILIFLYPSSNAFKRRFNALMQKYSDLCYLNTDGYKVETKVDSTYAYKLEKWAIGYEMVAVFYYRIDAINRAFEYVKLSWHETRGIFSDSTSVLQAAEGRECKNPFVNRLLQTCQEIVIKENLTLCWIPSCRDIKGKEDVRAEKDALSKAQPVYFELPCTDVLHENPAIYLIFMAGTVE